MQILLNEQNYVTSYMIVGELVNGIEIDTPENFEHFEENFYGYRYIDGNLEYVESKADEIKNTPPVPSQLDRIEAQLVYNSIMLGTLIEEV